MTVHSREHLVFHLTSSAPATKEPQTNQTQVHVIFALLKINHYIKVVLCFVATRQNALLTNSNGSETTLSVKDLVYPEFKVFTASY